ncbi:GDP-mannose 4,6-dehydratase [Pelagibacterales bacterium SAG-MED02]|nr:GDP-mannose 4,6-dehydratase [Pelagibacterales bacterium SAG-MED02]
MSNCVLITGGAGFIGSHLSEFLVKKKLKVIVIDNLSSGNIKNLKPIEKKIIFNKIDIANYNKLEKIFKKFKIKSIFHLAGKADIVPSIVNPKLYFETNVIGTQNILELSRKYKIKKIIYTASSTCYGIPKKYPTSEKDLISPQYPYALTKKIGEDLVLHYGKVYKIPSISLRLFNVYGTRSRTAGTYGAVLGVFLAQKIKNYPLTIVGNGKQSRDFTYVSDVVDAIYTVYKNKKKIVDVFNVGSGKSISVNSLADKISKNRIYIPKRPGEPDKTFADINKIKKTFNWKPKINLDKGMKIVLENIKYWNNAKLWKKSSIAKATKDWFKYLK